MYTDLGQSANETHRGILGPPQVYDLSYETSSWYFSLMLSQVAWADSKPDFTSRRPLMTCNGEHLSKVHFSF